MVDTRTKREKLEAMAADRSSPNEAAIARQKLQGLRAAEPQRTHISNLESIFVDPRPRDLGTWQPVFDPDSGAYIGRVRIAYVNGGLYMEMEEW